MGLSRSALADIALVRHGSVPAKFLHRYISKTDPGLCNNGLNQARSVAKFLDSAQYVSCFASPMKRTMETADIIADKAELPILVRENLREINFGHWEGMSFEEIASASPDLVTEWASGGSNFTFPGGENTGDFHLRIRKVISAMLEADSTDKIIVTHGGVFRTALCILLGIPFDHGFSFKVGYCATAVIRLNHPDRALEPGQLVFFKETHG